MVEFDDTPYSFEVKMREKDMEIKKKDKENINLLGDVLLLKEVIADKENTIDSRNTEAQELEYKIRELEYKIGELDGKIGNQSQAIHDLKGKFYDQANIIEKQRADIRELESEVEEQKKRISAQIKVIEEMKEIEEIENNLLVEKNSEIEKLDKRLNEKCDNLIEAHNDGFQDGLKKQEDDNTDLIEEQKDEILKLKKEIKEQDKIIDRKNDSLFEYNGKLIEYNERIAGNLLQIEEQKETISKLEGDKSLLNSCINSRDTQIEFLTKKGKRDGEELKRLDIEIETVNKQGRKMRELKKQLDQYITIDNKVKLLNEIEKSIEEKTKQKDDKTTIKTCPSCAYLFYIDKEGKIKGVIDNIDILTVIEEKRYELIIEEHNEI